METIEPQVPPPFDQNAFMAQMQESIKQTLSEQQSAPQPPMQPQVEHQPDEVEQFIQPYLDPAIRQANFASAAAVDYTKFYTKTKVVADGEEDITTGEISKKMADEIEKVFETMAKQGRPASREEIRDYLLGKELSANPQAVIEKQSKKRQQSQNRAASASDIGATHNVASFTNDQLYAMSQDQLTKALDNVGF